MLLRFTSRNSIWDSPLNAEIKPRYVRRWKVAREVGPSINMRDDQLLSDTLSSYRGETLCEVMK